MNFGRVRVEQAVELLDKHPSNLLVSTINLTLGNTSSILLLDESVAGAGDAMAREDENTAIPRSYSEETIDGWEICPIFANFELD